MKRRSGSSWPKPRPPTPRPRLLWRKGSGSPPRRGGSAQQLLTDARQAAERERAQLLERARREQEDLLDRARREIVAERDKALAALRREAVDLSLAAAAKLVGQRMDSETDRRLVTEYLDSVEIKH